MCAEIRYEFFFVYNQPTVPHMTEKRPGVIGAEPCRLEELRRSRAATTDSEPSARCPEESHSPRRGQAAPYHFGRRPHLIRCRRIPIRHPSAGSSVPCNPRVAPRTWFGNPYLNRYGAHSKHIPQARMYYWVAKSSRASLMPSRVMVHIEGIL